jgi:hypothetical protein
MQPTYQLKTTYLIFALFSSKFQNINENDLKFKIKTRLLSLQLLLLFPRLPPINVYQPKLLSKALIT